MDNFHQTIFLYIHKLEKYEKWRRIKLKLKILICVICSLISIFIGGTGAYFLVKKNESVKIHTYSLLKEKVQDEKEPQEVIREDNKNMEPIKAELTAYCNCEICSEEWGSQTAMMTVTKKGVVAAPEEISLGSILYIPALKEYKDDGIFSVEDRGGAVKVKADGTYIIDVWFSNHDDVVNFGRKKCIVYLKKDK